MGLVRGKEERRIEDKHSKSFITPPRVVKKGTGGGFVSGVTVRRKRGGA